MADNASLILEDRITILEARRLELEEKLKGYVSRMLEPIDTTLAELRNILLEIGGDGRRTIATTYDVQEPLHLMEGVSTRTARDVFASPRQLRRSTRSASPNDFVASPKTGTPVPTNAQSLKDALGGKK